MQIKLKARNVSFELEISEKYTVLTGNSATGKSTFYRKVLEYSSMPTPIQVESALPLKAVHQLQTVADLKETNVIYVVDENCNLMHELDQLNKVNAYFVLIIRDTIGKFSSLRSLPISVTSYLRFDCIKNKHIAKPIFEKFDEKYFGVVTKILTEDAKSSKRFFEEYFRAEVFSAKSNSHMPIRLAEIYNETDKFLVVYDSAAFGPFIHDLLRVLKNKVNVKVLDWESFETYLLASPAFGIELPKDTPCEYNSREIEATYILGNLIHYNKSVLPPCVRLDCACSNCRYGFDKDTFQKCAYSLKNNVNKRDIFIYDSVATIE